MKSKHDYDVIVVGGGPGGFAAALGAAKLGKRVLLIEQNSGPGGIGVFSGCPVLSGFQSLLREHCNSVSWELIEKLQELGGIMNGNRLNSSESMLQLAMTRLLHKHDVKMLFYATLFAVRKENDAISSLQVFCAGQVLDFSAAAFVDATGDAVLAMLAGAKLVCGKIEDSMTRTVLFKLENVLEFDKPSLKERFAQKKFPLPIQDCFMGTKLADGSILMNLTALSGDANDPWELTRMDRELREQVPVILRWLQKEFPEFANARLVSTAPRIGLRASRNIAGRKMLRKLDVDQMLPIDEPVALGKRSHGDHFVTSFNSPWRNYQPGVQPVPYGALLADPVQNLAAAGRCIAVETKVVSCVRLTAHCLSSGLAAGLAAALNFPEYEKLLPALRQHNFALAAFTK